MRTITKIVGVVPGAIRALMGLLIALALALGARSRVAALRARRLDRQRLQLLEDVGLLQAALLPVPPARLGPVATSVAYQPADGPGAGGDFYDVFALEDGRLGVIVGDISGHGRQALPHTALVRFTLRAYLEAGLSPRAAIQTGGSVLDGALGGSFATVVVASYHPRERSLTYACAGHPPPIVLGSEALATITLSGSPPLGVGMRTGTRQT
ncbi:MAG TPA: PP2C family serine/threonine-protein phosphatase, partial [Solirubrobacteraceae bacterium]